MNEKIIVDTAAWIALINRSDQLHEQAKAVMNQLREGRSKLVTTEFILVEVANALSKPPLRNRAVVYINGLRRLKTVQIVPASTELFQTGWLIYRRALQTGSSIDRGLSRLLDIKICQNKN